MIYNNILETIGNTPIVRINNIESNNQELFVSFPQILERDTSRHLSLRVSVKESDDD